MTKEQLQKELKDKLKEGVKPSDLKKLKRSKSDSDITPPFPPNQLLQDQLKEKQKQIEKLTEKLEQVNKELKETKQELDNSFQARAESLKDWDKQQERIKKLEQELEENVNEASQELISQDQNLVDLRKQINQLKLTNQSLQKDLNLTQRLVNLKDFSYSNPPDYRYLKLAFYGLLAVSFISYLNNAWEKHFKES